MVLSGRLYSQINNTMISNKKTILILGQSKVGKSTFINSLYVYSKYDSIKKYIEDKSYEKPKIGIHLHTEFDVRYKVDDNENTVNTNEFGVSSTLRPKNYDIKIGGNEYTLIDTPGIIDTRGDEQDIENVDMIINHLSTISINAIIMICERIGFRNAEYKVNQTLSRIFTNISKDFLPQIKFMYSDEISYDGKGNTEFFRFTDIVNKMFSDNENNTILDLKKYKSILPYNNYFINRLLVYKLIVDDSLKKEIVFFNDIKNRNNIPPVSTNLLQILIFNNNENINNIDDVKNSLSDVVKNDIFEDAFKYFKDNTLSEIFSFVDKCPKKSNIVSYNIFEIEIKKINITYLLNKLVNNNMEYDKINLLFKKYYFYNKHFNIVAYDEYKKEISNILNNINITITDKDAQTYKQKYFNKMLDDYDKIYYTTFRNDILNNKMSKHEIITFLIIEIQQAINLID